MSIGKIKFATYILKASNKRRNIYYFAYRIPNTFK